MSFPYQPLNISGNTTGLVQNRQEFLLPDDAYPTLQNAYIFREQMRRKQGATKLGRLKRDFEDYPLGETVALQLTYSFSLLNIQGLISGANNANPGVITTSAKHNLVNGDTVQIFGVNGATGYNTNSPFTVTVVTPFSFSVGVDAAAYGAYTSGGTFYSNRSLSVLEPNATIVPGSVSVAITGADVATFVDNGDGTFTVSGVGNAATSSIDYLTGALTIGVTAAAGGGIIEISYSYYPALPVMGARLRELNNINNEQTLFFDQRYCYRYTSSFEEFIPGTEWSGTNFEFFWSTNYWTQTNLKLFWVTNFSGTSGDPIRFTNGISWFNFGAGTAYGQVDAGGNFLNQCRAMLPFRSRLIAFNTFEGNSLSASIQYSNRIRWAAIGNPLTTDAWRDDIPGKGGYLDIPTSQAIVSVGFVRDNLVIYCERSTWQLRYTGRSIAPFQIEKVNSELGAESTFSAVQFDTSLVGIGDKGIVECDSFSSKTIDAKIPDLVITQFNNNNEGTTRVHGLRNFPQRLAYWIYPDFSTNPIFPNRRLVFNYENQSWAIFTDSYTCLGPYQAQTGLTWAQAPDPWLESNFSWVSKGSLFPAITAGNQQGYIMILDNKVTNDESLFITDISGNDPNVTVITSPNHNLVTGQIIQIKNIILGPVDDSYTSLNGLIFLANVLSADTFSIYAFDSTTGQFSDPNILPSQTYVGGGEILIRDNFNIVSKKFSFAEKGKNIQIGYIDILTNTTTTGAFSLYAYLNYNTNSPMNTLPENDVQNITLPLQASSDEFFNVEIPTVPSELQQQGTSKMWQRVFCPIRGNFITLEYTLSPKQMAGEEQESDVQIDAQVIWRREAGRMAF